MERVREALRNESSALSAAAAIVPRLEEQQKLAISVARLKRRGADPELSQVIIFHFHFIV
jgi:hypothetical protein